MSCRQDPTDKKKRDDDVAIHVVEDVLQHVSLDATISLLQKQIMKKAAEEHHISGEEFDNDVNEVRFRRAKDTHDASSAAYAQLVQTYVKKYDALTKEYAKDTEMLKHQNAQLKAALDKARRLLRQHSLAEAATSSSVPDTLATLPLLKVAVDQVQVDLTTCASRLLALADTHSLAVRNVEEFFHIGNHHVNAMNKTSRLQATLHASFLCQVLFCNFESPSFGGKNDQPFEKLWKGRQKRLQAFQKLRLVEVGHISMLQQQDVEFDVFVRTKSKLMETELRKLVKHADDECACDSNCEHPPINEFLTDLWINKLFKVSFLRLAKALWQLHELAFAFEPSSAEIFRVSPDSVYDEEYMQEAEESMMQAKEWDKMGEYGSEKHVLFMGLPGFTVGTSIIKSQVFLNHS